MKKIIALVLSLCLLLALCAGCGSAPTADDVAEIRARLADMTATLNMLTARAMAENAGAIGCDIDPDDIEDVSADEAGVFPVAFVADAGVLKDGAENENVWNGVKLFAYKNNLSYRCYEPANGENAAQSDRYAAMQAAVDGGADVIVCVGSAQADALAQAAGENPAVLWIYIGGALPVDADGNAPSNVACILFHDEQSGYLAGYAAVMDGCTQLGFSGSGSGADAARCRYGYGFVQGANDAAAALDEQVEVKFSWLHGAYSRPSNDLRAMAADWYQSGTEVIFSCGGDMFDSVAEAAAENDGYVIAADCDRTVNSAAVLTSAVENMDAAAYWAIAKVYDGTWDDIGGAETTLGLADGAVGLPTTFWHLESFTLSAYEELLAKLQSGELTVDADYEANLRQEYSSLTLTMVE